MPDVVDVAGNVIDTFEPSAKVSDVVAEPSLLVVDVLEAPCKACSSGSALGSVLLEAPDVLELAA